MFYFLILSVTTYKPVIGPGMSSAVRSLKSTKRRKKSTLGVKGAKGLREDPSGPSTLQVRSFNNYILDIIAFY